MLHEGNSRSTEFLRTTRWHRTLSERLSVPRREKRAILLAMLYLISAYLRADGMEEEVLATFVLVGPGLLLGVVDTISVAVAYLD